MPRESWKYRLELDQTAMDGVPSEGVTSPPWTVQIRNVVLRLWSRNWFHMMVPPSGEKPNWKSLSSVQACVLQFQKMGSWGTVAISWSSLPRSTCTPVLGG